MPQRTRQFALSIIYGPIMKKIVGDVNLYAMEIPVILPRHSYIDSHKRVDYLTSLPISSQPPRKPKAIQPPVYARLKKQVPNKTQEWRNQVSPHVPLSGDFDSRINYTAIDDYCKEDQIDDQNRRRPIGRSYSNKEESKRRPTIYLDRVGPSRG